MIFRLSRTTFFLIFSILSGLFPPHAEGQNAVLVKYHSHISVKNGKLTREILYVIQINNRQGDEYADITIHYSKLNRVSRVEGYISDTQGNIVRKLKKNEISDHNLISDYSFYEDHFVKEFTLKHDVYPYRIIYSYQIQKEQFLYLAYWVPVLDYDIPTKEAVLTLEVPGDYPCTFSQRFIESQTHDTLDGTVRHTWRTSYPKTLEQEILSPPLDRFMPEVIAVPENFYYEKKGSFRSWKRYGNWEYEILQGLSGLPDSEKEKIRRLTAGLQDTTEMIRKLYHYLQDETRYINISIKTGGLIPYPAGYVARNKYGDCKALTNYFKAVLAFTGIRSLYTDVSAGRVIPVIDKTFPSQQFNHVILCVPNSGDTLWLDCTSKGPFNYLGTFTQNRDVFMVEKDNSHFTRTPRLTPRDMLVRRKVTFSPRGEYAETSFSNEYRGREYEKLNYLLHAVNETTRNRFIRNSLVEKGFELLDFDLEKADRDSAVVRLSFHARTNRIYRKYGNDLLIGLLPFQVPPFTKPGVRKLPVQINYPVYKKDSLCYEIPQGYTLSHLPEAMHLANRFGRYDITYRTVDGKVLVTKAFLLNDGNYTPEEYPDLYDFVHKVYVNEKKSFIVFNTPQP